MTIKKDTAAMEPYQKKRNIFSSIYLVIWPNFWYPFFFSHNFLLDSTLAHNKYCHFLFFHFLFMADCIDYNFCSMLE